MGVTPKRQPARVMIAVLVAGFAAASALCQPLNLVSNGGFEQVGEDGMPSGWGTWLTQLPEPGCIAVDDEVAHAGRRSLRISHREPDSYSMVTQRVEFAPGKSYVIDCWMKADGIEPGVVGGCARLFVGIEGNNPFTTSQAFTGSFDWRFVEIGPFEVHERTWLTLIPYLHKATGTVWFDDVSFREVTEADLQRRAQRRARAIASRDLDIVEATARGLGAAALLPEITALRGRLDASDDLPTSLPAATPLPWFSIHAEVFRLMARANQVAWADVQAAPAVHARWVVPFSAVQPVMPSVPCEQERSELVEMLRGEVEAACLRLTNLTADPHSVSLHARGLTTVSGLGLPVAGLTWREVSYVELRTEEIIADPLVRIAAGAGPVEVQLAPGMTRDVWLMVNSAGVQAGLYSGTVEVTAAGRRQDLGLSVRVYPLDLPEKLDIRTFAYAYTFWPILKGRIPESRADLVAHHINSYVLQRQFTPWVEFDQNGNWLGLNWREMDAQLALHPNAECFLLIPKLWSSDGSGRLPPEGGPEYPSDEWKALVGRWARELAEGMAERGFDYDQWAIYFVDEPSGEGAQRLRHSGDAAHLGDPRIRIFANPYGTASDEDMEVMAPAVDIWCPMLSTAEGERLEFCRRTADEVWMYQVLGKLAAPVERYRLGFWEAFVKQLGGHGFWCYADVTGSAWDAYDDPRHDYGVIYDGDDDELTPSLRWEGYREGAEDYAMLCMLAERPGWDRDRVTRLARRVLDGPDAESVHAARRRVIRALNAQHSE